MAFLDDEDALSGPSIPDRRRREPRRAIRQQIVFRRLIAVGVGLLLVLLFGLGLKACFNARNRSALKDYVNRDVRQIAVDSQQTSDQLFKTLNDPKGLTRLDYENEIKSARSAAEGLVARASKLGAPDDMKTAHHALELSLQLQRDGLQTISDNVSTSLAREGRARAIGRISQGMRSFLASDVVYSRIAQVEMQRTLSAHGIGDVRVPTSQFLPSSPNWLDPAVVTAALSKVTGSSAAAGPGTHGLGLVPSGVAIAGTTLQSGAPAQVTISGTPELDVQVQNQGSVEETGITLTVTINGGGPTTLEGTIPRIGPGAIETAKIPITPTPAKGTQLTIEIDVQPVPGETVQTNNKASYTVTFN
ncbi:MAG: hypothetical protein QOJ38_912 [Solirubrobacterales bacterium]|nr:hypothetical protein [Solirubrobacterales bacterium]